MSAESPGKNTDTDELLNAPDPQTSATLQSGESKVPSTPSVIKYEQPPEPTELAGSQQWQQGPLFFLADIATGNSLNLAQQRQSTAETLAETSHALAALRSQEALPSTSCFTLSHPISTEFIEGEISDTDLLQKLAEFDEAEFEISSSVGSLSLEGGSTPNEEPFSKYSRTEYLPETISSSEFYSSSSSSSRSPTVPVTVDEIEDNQTAGKPEVLLGNTTFWKYKQIPKGPQGLTFERQVAPPQDPSQPLEFQDPAFVASANTAQLTHFGKARIGEGNDTTPDPEKLAKLGHTIRDLGRRMTEIKDEKHSKEKIKLSSSQGRLRKISNNEANKIIFDGMETEKSELTRTIREVKAVIATRETEMEGDTSSDSDIRICDSLEGKVNSIIGQMYQTKVAGQAGLYIDNILAEHGYISG